MRSRKKKFICFILTIALCVALGGGYVRADETSKATAQGINVAYHTQDEIKAFCNASGVTVDDPLTYSEKPVVSGNYSAGKLSDKTLNSAVKMLNCVRYIAGISEDVQLNEEYNSMTQAAALVNYLNNELSHYPEKPLGIDEDLYKLGAKGAGSSNIAWVSWDGNSLNSSIINGWMEDGDSYNIDIVGHRRWILNPKMKYTGFGAVSGKNGTYSAMYSFDYKNTSANEYGVAWPAQNMPVEYFGTEYPWSVSMGKIVDITSVNVTLTRESDGKTWNFSKEAADGYFNVNNGGYGQKGCIIFRPKTDRRYKAGDIYDVYITGLGKGNDVSYSVDFFSLTKTATPTVKPTAAPTEKPTIIPTKEPTAVPVVKPTEKPAATPTVEPTAIPTVVPTVKPTVMPTIKPSGNTGGDGTVNYSKPAIVKIKKWSVKKNKLTVYFGKVKNASGYQFRYSTDAKFKRNLKHKDISAKTTKTKFTLKKSSKKHYIQIRAYTKKNGQRIYGQWGEMLVIIMG